MIRNPLSPTVRPGRCRPVATITGVRSTSRRAAPRTAMGRRSRASCRRSSPPLAGAVLALGVQSSRRPTPWVASAAGRGDHPDGWRARDLPGPGWTPPVPAVRVPRRPWRGRLHRVVRLRGDENFRLADLQRSSRGRPCRRDAVPAATLPAWRTAGIRARASPAGDPGPRRDHAARPTRQRDRLNRGRGRRVSPGRARPRWSRCRWRSGGACSGRRSPRPWSSARSRRPPGARPAPSAGP